VILKNKKIVFGIFIGIAAILALAFYYLGTNNVMPQSSIYFLDDVKLPDTGQKVLVYTPHPDDESIAAGGYIAESIERGASVKIVLVTDGNKHGLRDKRYLEFKKATSILGVSESNLTFLNYSDGNLNKADQTKLLSDLEQQMKDFEPDIVVYPNPLDQHPDHSLVGKDVKKILENIETITAYQYLVHYPNFPQPKMFRMDLYLLPAQNAVRFDKEWLRLILTSGAENKKEQAIFSYKTQIRVPVLRSLMLSSIRKNELFSEGN